MSNEPVPLATSPLPITLFSGKVEAGFPSPCADYAHGKINLNEHLFLNENASYLFRVQGDSMTNIGIYTGDTLIVDRSITPEHNHIVLAIVDEEFTIKRLFKRRKEIKLVAENPAFADIVFSEGQELRVWGVVTYNLHKLLHV